MIRLLGGCSLILVIVLYPVLAHSFSDGAPARYSGAPGETTCHNAGCHNSFALDSGPGTFTILVPAAYAPGDTAALTVRLEQQDVDRFGFQISVRDADGEKVGQFELANATRTRFASEDRDYVTHRYSGTRQSDVAEWGVRWIAPDADVGPVTFYAAGNAADGDGTNDGDYVYTAEQVVESASSVGVVLATTPAHVTLQGLYPQPATATTRVEYALPAAVPVTVTLYDALGRQVQRQPLGMQAAGARQARLDVAALPPGLYLVELATPAARQVRTLVVAR